MQTDACDSNLKVNKKQKTPRLHKQESVREEKSGGASLIHNHPEWMIEWECVARDIWEGEGLQMLSHHPGHCEGWHLGMRASQCSVTLKPRPCYCIASHSVKQY